MLGNHQKRLHVRGYSAAELCANMNCAEVYNMNYERNAHYTRLKLRFQLLTAAKVYDERESIQCFYGRRNRAYNVNIISNRKIVKNIELYAVLQIKIKNSNKMVPVIIKHIQCVQYQWRS